MIPRVSFFKVNRLFRQHGPEFAGQLQQQYGDYFYVRSPLPKLPRLYFVFDATDTYRLLVKQRPMLEKPVLMLRSMQSSFGNGLFTSRGETWQRQRKLMQPAFHHGQIGRYAAQIVQHTEEMLAGWQDGNKIAIDKAMHALTFTIIVDALFSANAAKKTDVVQQAMHNLGQALAAQSQSLPLLLMPDWAPLPTLRQKRRGTRTLNRLVREMITERRALGQANSPPDLLSTLLFTQDEETGKTMSNRQLRDELVTLYIAGHETTAILLDWTWILLFQNPNTAAELRTELDLVLNGRSPTFDDLPQLTITGAIIKEVLRLYPAAWCIFREAPEGLEIQGETIPEGSVLVFFPYTVQRDNRLFEDAQTFRPTRWLDGLEQSLPKGVYFPFGLGPRTCIGNGFAQMEAQLILAAIAQQFQLEQLNEAKMAPAPTLSFIEPVYMRLSKVGSGEHLVIE